MKPTRYKKAKKNSTDNASKEKENQSKKAQSEIMGTGLPHPPSVPIKPS